MKKPIVKVLILVIPLIILSLILFFAIRGNVQSNRTSIVLSSSNLVFSEVGETAELTATIIRDGVQLNSSESETKIMWTTSDPSVAVVENGLVISVGYGSCSIRASWDDFSSFCTVSNPNPNPPLSITAEEIVLENIGKRKTLYAISGSGEDISSMANWRSSNESIAVCEDGIITAVGYGSCSITAIYNRKTAVCFVTVKNPTAPQITLSSDKLNLKAGESVALTAKTDYDAGENIIWKSSDESVATCENGVITAKKDGKCAIVAITELGYTDVCSVTVGSANKNNEHDKFLIFDFPNLEKELLCVDKSIGQIISSAIVIDYDMKTLLLDDGRLVIEITLICIKTYDKDGIDGRNPAMVTASLYRENATFCDKKIYKSESVSVGDRFEIKCAGFTVQTKTDGTARELYMTFASITEK